MDSTIMNFSTNVLDTLLIFYCIVKLLDIRSINVKRTTVILSWAIIINTFINEVFGLANILGFIVMFSILIIFYYYILNKQLYKILIAGIIAIITMFIIEIVVANIVVIVFNLSPAEILGLNIYKILAILGAKGSFYLVIRYAMDKLKSIKSYSVGRAKPIILIGIFNIIVIFMAITLFKYMESGSIEGYIYLISMVISAIIFTWLIYRVTMDKMYQDQKEMIWKIKEEEFYKNNFYEKNIKEILDSIKSQKHDLNNYLSTLYGLIHLENFQEAKEYIKNLDNRINNMNTIVETNNPIISALVSIKKNKAFEDNINMNIDIELPEELLFDYVDLSIIIGNLLDNALEACLLIDEKLKRNIELLIDVNDNNLIIEIINTKSTSIKVNTEKIFRRFTTKKDKYNHGLGLGNIEFIVRQYKGSMEIADLGDKFKVNILLPMETHLQSEMNLVSHLV